MQRASPIRWIVLSIVFGLSFVAYLLRMNISVAAKLMMPELGLDEVQMGWVFSSFLWGYTLLQFPGGLLSNRIGSRRMLALIAIVCGVATLLTGLVPGLVLSSNLGILGSLLLLRFLLGAFQGPLYPAVAGTVARWFPKDGWALPHALSSTGLGLGAAMTPPLVSQMMVRLGWRASYYVLAPLGLVSAVIWWWYFRDDPAEHGSVNRAELSLITGDRPSSEASEASAGAFKLLLRNREIWLLSLSYLCMNYVFYIFFFWFFIYLVDVRGFSILGGGMLAALPFLVGAIAATVGGATCDWLCGRLGARRGCGLVAMTGMFLVAILLYFGAAAESPYVAIGLLSFCFGFTQFTEGAFWAATTYVAGRNTAAATGVLNTGGNLGGVISTPLIPILAAQVGWIGALSTGSLFAVISALLWLWIRVDRPLEASD